MGSPDALVCPACERAHPSSERFCSSCGMPLVQIQAPGDERSKGATDRASVERRDRLRKIKPQYAEGKLVRAVGVRNHVEAEFIQGLLLEEGIPSLIRNSIAGYGPVVGTHEVMVPESGAVAAREALLFKRP